jgi:hypothetical protein
MGIPSLPKFSRKSSWQGSVGEGGHHAAGAMSWMVFAELIPEALDDVVFQALLRG